MRRAALAVICLLLAVSPEQALARHHARHRATHQPVVVELFTSQDISSSAETDKLMSQLAGRPGVLALTFAVDYWDYLGWTDTFAKPEFTARQKAYMQRLAQRDLYTPEVIVDGKGQAEGTDPKKIEALILDAQHARVAAPRMRFLRHSRVGVGWGRRPPGGADVWLVRYDPQVEEVTVKRGENRGQTLRERNVVRDLVRLGGWFGRPKSYAIPPAGPKDQGLKTAILLQQAKGGRILAVLQR